MFHIYKTNMRERLSQKKKKNERERERERERITDLGPDFRTYTNFKLITNLSSTIELISHLI